MCDGLCCVQYTPRIRRKLERKRARAWVSRPPWSVPVPVLMDGLFLAAARGVHAPSGLVDLASLISPRDPKGA